MNKAKKNHKICVLGGGLWGTVLAQLLAAKGNPVSLWEFFPELAENLEKTRKHQHIPDFELDASVRVTSELSQAVADAGVIVFVLPSSHLRAAAKNVAKALKTGDRPIVVNASKGIDSKTLQTMGEVIEQELPKLKGRVYTLSGPSFAREVARGVPTAVIVAGPAKDSSAVVKLFDGDRLRVTASSDRKGVELGGSLKNVLAIGAGILDGLKAGANSKAALITQGLTEMTLIIHANGGRKETAYGLAGIGDLIATGTSLESRNRLFGEKLGLGMSPQAAVKEIPTVTEGADAAQSAHRLIARRRVKCPLFEAIWKVVYDGEAARSVLTALGF